MSASSTGRPSGVRIGRLAGIDIRVHPTFLIIVVLVALGGLGPPIEGAIWLGLVFGCVVLHELAHSVVARHRGVAVREILLLPIGGVSEMESLPDRPRDELAIAAVGPLMSITIAGVAATIATVAGVEPLPPSLEDGPLIARVVWVNVMLALFNLLPAFPMDGGRVLRAALAPRAGLERATRLAARLGRIVAVAMGLEGVIYAPWLTIIAVFVYIGSATEERATIVHLRLAPWHVADLMVTSFATLGPADDVGAAAAALLHTSQRHVPVVDGGRYIGVVDLGRAPLAGAARECLTPAPVLAASDDLAAAVDGMVAVGARGAAVVRGGRVVGILLLDDVAALLARAASQRSEPTAA